MGRKAQPQAGKTDEKGGRKTLQRQDELAGPGERKKRRAHGWSEEKKLDEVTQAICASMAVLSGWAGGGKTSGLWKKKRTPGGPGENKRGGKKKGRGTKKKSTYEKKRVRGRRLRAGL